MGSRITALNQEEEEEEDDDDANDDIIQGMIPENSSAMHAIPHGNCFSHPKLRP